MQEQQEYTGQHYPGLEEQEYTGQSYPGPVWQEQEE